jgi:hypothetical protein
MITSNIPFSLLLFPRRSFAVGIGLKVQDMGKHLRRSYLYIVMKAPVRSSMRSGRAWVVYVILCDLCDLCDFM